MNIEIRKKYSGHELSHCDQFASIKDIKNYIQKEKGIPIKQQNLFYQGILQLDSNPIEDNAIFLLTLKMGGGDEIFVKGFDGRTISINLPNKFNTTIQEVKQSIQAKLGVSPEEIDLIYGGQELKDHTTLGDAGIQNESTLHLVRKTFGGHQIFVKVLDGKVISLELPNNFNTTTDEIFDAIRNKISIDLSGFDLVYGGEIITPGKTLMEAGLQNEATLHLVKHTEGGSGNQIYVKTAEGKFVTIDLPNDFSTTIKQIKDILADKINIDTQKYDINLVYGGEQLTNNNSTLEEIGIQLNSTITMIIKVKGG